MAIYYRPGGNNANGGTNATTDAKQTLAACLPLINLSDASKRNVVACADTVGGTATFTTPSGYTFFNNNESLFPSPTSEAQRLTFEGRAGDTIIFRWTSTGLGWLWKTKCSYVSFLNMEFDLVNGGNGGDMFRWFTQSGTSFLHNIVQDLVFQGNPSGHNFGATDPYTQFMQVLDCESYNAGRSGSGLANNFYCQGRDNLIRGCISDRSITPIDANKGGIRLYTNEGDIAAGRPEAARNTVERCFSGGSAANFTIAGNDGLWKNNLSVRARGYHYEFLEQLSGTNTRFKFLNNTAFGEQTASYGLRFFHGVATAAEIQNNILYGMTTPLSLNGITPSVNANNTTTDPTFVASGTELQKLSIQTTSNSKNTGATRSEVLNDYYGTNRPQGASYDRGAIEFVEDPPSDTDGLRVINPTTAPALAWDPVVGRTHTRIFVEWGGVKRWWEAVGSVTLGTQTNGSGRFNLISESPIVLPAQLLLFSIRQYDGATPLEAETAQIAWDNS